MPRPTRRRTRSSRSGARSATRARSSSTPERPRLTGHERRNREFWDADADDYQAAHAEQLARGKVWGAWAQPEDELRVLGDTRGLDVLELGCGAAEWSLALSDEGARAVGLDQSRAQLRHAREKAARRGAAVPFACASAEALPFRDGAFDLVFADHGAPSFCDPERLVPEVARVLRPGGRFAFNIGTYLMYLTYDWRKEKQTTRLHVGYFERRVFDTGEGSVDFQIPHGEWIRLFRACGLTIERLEELRPPPNATTTYDEFVPPDWAQRWPAEEIWVVRKA